ncbi:hypothetical protein NI17_009335 [Thermobifida halotolerans]|uniref:DUF600 family protein n=1 Tax=Thermobifida halotolerans TaxID=483545 RepID=A0AA97LZW0_9ACTN|nr:hypothetical protein [Thermobifida halotolerans]UOE21307.1 hypothetical protein NI17_009335 [Thermobifida halotolerans]
MNRSIDPLGSEEQEALLKEVGALLVGAAPDDWQEISLTYVSTVDRSTMRTEAKRGGGAEERFPASSSIFKKMNELRWGMYIPGRGTWFSAFYAVERPNRFRVEYDYDGEPAFNLPPVSASYALDLQYFPRDEEHIPDWLRQKLREAESGQG